MHNNKITGAPGIIIHVASATWFTLKGGQKVRKIRRETHRKCYLQLKSKHAHLKESALCTDWSTPHTNRKTNYITSNLCRNSLIIAVS